MQYMNTKQWMATGKRITLKEIFHATCKNWAEFMQDFLRVIFADRLTSVQCTKRNTKLNVQAQLQNIVLYKYNIMPVKLHSSKSLP